MTLAAAASQKSWDCEHKQKETHPCQCSPSVQQDQLQHNHTFSRRPPLSNGCLTHNTGMIAKKYCRASRSLPFTMPLYNKKIDQGMQQPFEQTDSQGKMRVNFRLLIKSQACNPELSRLSKVPHICIIPLI